MRLSLLGVAEVAGGMLRLTGYGSDAPPPVTKLQSYKVTKLQRLQLGRAAAGGHLCLAGQFVFN